MNALEARGLTKTFFRTVAVNAVSLALPQGSVNVLVGANGAGKTTLLRVLLNLLAPTAGESTVLGESSRRLGPAQWRRIGFVAEETVQPATTVGGLLDAWRALYPTWDRDLENKLVREFELPLDRALKALSRGMRMKAQLLSVLPYRPELLVLDEPFGGLDPLVREQVVQGVLELVSAEGCTVLVSSHDIVEVETLADRILWMERGALRLVEEADSLRTRFRRVEIAAPESPPPHAWAVDRLGGSVRYIDPQFDPGRLPAGANVEPMTLREIFLALLRQSPAGLNPSSTPLSR
ncbi:MAG: ABC transporter ATP-binding protein [Opitutaceae bacterium]|nr:ABC transporter ATP-binding protein [Opitutaceae bacterium]